MKKGYLHRIRSNLPPTGGPYVFTIIEYPFKQS